MCFLEFKHVYYLKYKFINLTFGYNNSLPAHVYIFCMTIIIHVQYQLCTYIPGCNSKSQSLWSIYLHSQVFTVYFALCLELLDFDGAYDFSMFLRLSLLIFFKIFKMLSIPWEIHLCNSILKYSCTTICLIRLYNI